MIPLPPFLLYSAKLSKLTGPVPKRRQGSSSLRSLHIHTHFIPTSLHSRITFYPLTLLKTICIPNRRTSYPLPSAGSELGGPIPVTPPHPCNSIVYSRHAFPILTVYYKIHLNSPQPPVPFVRSEPSALLAYSEALILLGFLP